MRRSASQIIPDPDAAEELESADSLQAERISAGLHLAMPTNADQAASDLNLSRRSGLPPALVAHDRDGAELSARNSELDLERMTRESPGTAKALEDPDVLSIGHDDTTAMERLERMARAAKVLQRPFDVLQMSKPERILRDVGQFGQKSFRDLEIRQILDRDFRMQPDPFDEDRLQELQEQTVTDFQLNVLEGVPGAISEQIAIHAEQIVGRAEGAVAGAIGGGIATLTPAGAVAGGLLGNQLGGFRIAQRAEQSGIWGAVRHTQDADGNQIDPDTARSIAVAGGLLAGGLEFAGSAALLRRIPAVGRMMTSFSTDGMKELLRSRTFTSATRHLTAAIAAGVVTEGATEGAQELVAVGAEVTAIAVVADMISLTGAGKALSELTHDVKQPDGSMVRLQGAEAVMARVMESAVRGAQAGGGFAGVAETGSIARDLRASQRATERQPVINRLIEAAKGSKIRKRDPETFGRFVQDVVDTGQAPEEVYISSDAVREYFQGADEQEAAELLENVPSLARQDADVSRTGGEFVVPLSEYLTHVAPSGLGAAVQADIRFDAVEMTLREAQVAEESAAAQFAGIGELASVTEEDQAAESLLRDELTTQLSKQFPPNVVEVMVALTMARTRTRAQRAGTTIQDLLEREGVFRVEPAQALEGEKSPTLERRLERRRLAEVVGDIREGRQPELRGLPARPILGLLRDLGGVDPTSEAGQQLQDIDIPRSGIGSLPGLFRPGGSVTDLSALDLAGEEIFVGNLQEVVGDIDSEVELGRLDPEQILEAIRAEVAGKPLRTETQNAAIAAAQEERGRVAEAIGAAELDLETATVEEILDALQGQEFEQPAFHGTPHVFDKFTLDHIGTGEGAQAFGWGLYFAESEDLARYYKEQLQGPAKRTFKGEDFSNTDVQFALADAVSFGRSFQEIQHLAQVAAAASILFHAVSEQRGNGKGNVEITERHVQQTRAMLEQRLRAMRDIQSGYLQPAPKDDLTLARATRNIGAIEAELENLDLIDLADIKHVSSPASVKEVEIPDASDLLDYDLPLSQQPAEVKGKLEEMIGALEVSAEAELEDLKRRGLASPGASLSGESFEDLRDSLRGDEALDGRDLYAAISRLLGSDEAASIALREAGIPGLQYWDGGSRDAGDGTHNFVIWDQDAIQVLRTFEQPDAEGTPRGSIRGLEDLEAQQVVIRFTEATDLSTFLHESGHLWLAQLQADAGTGGASEQITADWAAVREWLGLAEGETPTTEHHERWAAAVELWTFEGRAPSIELGDIFRRFQDWLIGVYKSLRHAHFQDLEATEGIREVMDRLVATDEELRDARDARGLIAPDMSAWTEAEQDAYVDARERGVNEQRTSLTRRRMAQVKRQAKEEWRSLRRAVEAEVEAQLATEGVWRAKEWLRRGLHIGDVPPGMEEFPHTKLDKTALVGMFPEGKAILDELGRGRFAMWQKADGLLPDFVAEAFGMRDGADLVRALADSGTFKEDVKRRTDALMKELHGDLESSQALEDALSEAMTNDATIDALLIEERALARESGGRVTPRQALRQVARQLVNRTRMGELRPDRYRRAALREGRATVEAVAAGDAAAAKSHKQRQVFALLMETEARKQRERADKDRGRVAKLQRKKDPLRKKIQKAGDIIVNGESIGSYWGRIEGLLSRFDLRLGVSRAAQAAPRSGLLEMMMAMDAAGENIIVAEALLDETFRKPWKDLTVGEFRALVDAIDNIAHLARRKVEYMTGREHRAIAAVQEELATEAVANLEARTVAPPGEKERLRDANQKWLSLESNMEKMEFLVDTLDGGKPDGPWRRHVWQPIAAAEAKRNELAERYTRGFVGLMQDLTAGRASEIREKKTYNELYREGLTDGRYSRLGLIAIALNWGNLSNREKLIGPNGYGWDEQTVKRILDQELTEQDWAFVAAVWKLIDGLWPDIVANEKRMSGVAPAAVEGVDVEMPFGTIKGGYYPVAYNPELSDKVAGFGQKDEVYAQENGVFKPTTGHGHTYERTKFAAPILLDLDVIPAHIGQVVHDLAHRETILRVDTITQGREVRAALKATVGPAQADLFRPWLQSIAQEGTGQQRSLTAADWLLGTLRRNQTAYTLAFRATTLAMQVGGHSNGIAHLRERLPGGTWKKHWLKGTLKTMGAIGSLGHISLYQSIAAQSPMMRDRPENIDRDMREIVRRAKVATPRVVVPFTEDAPVEWAMKLIGRVQLYMVDIPLWLAAYEGGVQEHGLEHDAAVSFADQAVSMSQGAGSAKDLSALQRGGEGLKAFSLFSSYNFTVYAQNRSAFRHLRQQLTPEAFANFLINGVFRLTIPGVFAALVRSVLTGRSDLPEDDENYWLWLAGITAGEVAGTIPVARESSGAIAALVGGGNARYFQSQLPPQKVVSAAIGIAKGKDATEKALALLRFGGMVTGRVPDQAIDLAELAVEK